jgi:hypothetical protein
MNKDAKFLAEAYEAINEAKKKLSPAQKKIAAAAPPPDEITGADFKALKAKKKAKKDNKNLGEAYEAVLEKKAECKYALKGCDCDGCDDCRANREKEEEV